MQESWCHLCTGDHFRFFFSEFQVPVALEGNDSLLTQCNAFVVEARDLECPEYCFKVPFNCFHHPRYNTNIHQLTAVILALSNSVGGVVILCRKPGQNERIEVGQFSFFKERLEGWILKENDRGGADMMRFLHMSEDEAIWAMIFVEPRVSTDLTSANIDESDFLLCKPAVLSNEASTSYISVAGLSAATLKPVSQNVFNVPEYESEKALSEPVSLTQPIHTMTDSEIQEQLGEKVSWTKHKSNWQQYVVQDDVHSLESNVNKYGISSQVFTPRDPVEFTPSHMLKVLLSDCRVRNLVVEQIKIRLDSQRAFGIVSPSWLSYIGMKEAAQRPKSHIGDILLVTENGGVSLCTIVQHCHKEDDVPKAYLITTGRLTKLLLLKEQHQKCVLRVDCYLFILENCCILEPPFQEYTKSFFVNTVELKHIQKTLAQHIVTQESYLKNVIGEVCSYKLSAEQWEVVRQGTSVPVMVVSGPPGSGKTFLCAHCLQLKGSKKESIYVSMNHALGAFMKSQNTCSVQTVQSDAELKTIIEQGEFNTKTCIVFDDAHRFSCSIPTIKQLLTLLKNKKEVHLYVFHDNEFQCFDEIENPFPDMVTQCCKTMRIGYAVYPLGQVHRNTRRVASFISAISFKGEITCLNKLEGDDVEVLAVEKPLADSCDNPLIQNILQVLRLEDPENHALHYAAQDIAVLIDTDKLDQDLEQCQQILRNYIPEVDVHSAATFPRTGIVVDCLDSFHGLDAGVCFCILSSRRMTKQNQFNKILQRSIYNPRYLAFLASRAIFKVVFLIPKLDTDVFKEMLFDCVDEKMIKVGSGSFLAVYCHKDASTSFPLAVALIKSGVLIFPVLYINWLKRYTVYL